MIQHYFLIAMAISLFGLAPGVFAEEKVADLAASLVHHEVRIDARAQKLDTFLTAIDSPLAPFASDFVSEADRFSLDWKFVAAIAGLESSFGKRIPQNSYNGWGWGIPTGTQGGLAFSDWNHAIRTVSEGLRGRYIDRGAVTIEQIGQIYAASPTWAFRVRSIMARIESFSPSGVESLDFTL